MATNEQLSQRIIDLVRFHEGIKAVDLTVKLATEFLDVNSVEILEAIMALVIRGDIIELQYTLPHMQYRVKSIYFPKGTEFIS